MKKSYKDYGFQVICSNFDYAVMGNKEGMEIIVDRNTGKYARTSHCIAEVSINPSIYTWFSIDSIEGYAKRYIKARR
jgi:hypothetical protein